jgi:methanogenic corrinoid protein MtbC1
MVRYRRERRSVAEAAARLFEALVDQDPAAAIAEIETARASGMEQQRLFDAVFAPAMSLLGAAWADGTIDEDVFAKASVVAEQVASFVAGPASASDSGVTVLLGVVQGDRHDVAKSIDGAALRAVGHRVVDLGADVRPAVFLRRAEESGARIVIAYAETVESAPVVRRVREMFRAVERDVVLFVAGGPFTADEDLARGVGANGVVHGSEGAVRLVEQAVGAAPATGGV